MEGNIGILHVPECFPGGQTQARNPGVCADQGGRLELRGSARMKCPKLNSALPGGGGNSEPWRCLFLRHPSASDPLRWPAGGGKEAAEGVRLCSGNPPRRAGAGHGLEGEPSDPDPNGDPRPWMNELSPGSPGPKKQHPSHCPSLQLGSSKPHVRTRQPNPGEALAPQLHWTRGAWLKTQLATPRTSEPFSRAF